MERLKDDWLLEHGDYIRCVSLNAADALFSAAAMAKGLAPTNVAWWWLAYDALDATAKILSCAAPPRKAFEETFDGEAIHCQCAEVAGQLFLDYLDGAGNRVTLSNSEIAEAKQIESAAIAGGEASCNWTTVEGEKKIATYEIGVGSKPLWYIVPTLNTGCCSSDPPVPPIQPYPDPIELPSWDDRFPDCPSFVSLLDSTIDRFGLAQNFYEVKYYWSSDCTAVGKFWYWTTHVGPYKYNNSGSCAELDSEPKYGPPHPFAALPNGSGLVNTGLSSVQYHLDVGCTYNPETDDFETKYLYDVEATNDGIFGLARRMDALAWMINNAQLIPYTSCATQKPVLEGQWVTTRWESDEKMAHSGRRLRKLFRYRTKSSRDLGQLSAYWENFTWKSGDVCVRHTGAWWGDPQVWAESAEEGQRVIRHAATEAGIDPDQVGRWATGSSRSPRYGMSGTMRILRNQDFPWVASRSGAPWPNVLAKPGDP